jgi:hypothetical protein
MTPLTARLAELRAVSPDYPSGWVESAVAHWEHAT